MLQGVDFLNNAGIYQIVSAALTHIHTLSSTIVNPSKRWHILYMFYNDRRYVFHVLCPNYFAKHRTIHVRYEILKTGLNVEMSLFQWIYYLFSKQIPES